MKFLSRFAKELLWNDGWVELWDFSRSNESEESRVETLAKVASVCYDKEPSNPEALIKRLSTENAGAPASSFEFIRSGFSPIMNLSLRNYPSLPCQGSRLNLFSFKYMRKKYLDNIAVFRMRVPIFIARQVMRHRSFSYQELSRRYTKGEVNFWIPYDNEDEENIDMMMEAYANQAAAYKTLLRQGLRAERARAVLGAGLYTEFWMMGAAGDWWSYFKARGTEGVQLEHKQLATKMANLIFIYQPDLFSKILEGEE